MKWPTPNIFVYASFCVHSWMNERARRGWGSDCKAWVSVS